MKITQFMNPFATHHPSEFPDVVIPMQRARRHSSIISKQRSKEGDTESGTSDHNVLTVESLIAEIEDDLAASGHDTAYDRMFDSPILPNTTISLEVEFGWLGRAIWC